MAGSTITYPLNGASNWENFTDIVQRIQSGRYNFSFDEMDTGQECDVLAGSHGDLNGTICQFTAAETPTGFAALGNDNFCYLYLQESSGSVTAVWSLTVPTWSASKRGWYNGNDRAVLEAYKDADGNQANKLLMDREQYFTEDGTVVEVQEAVAAGDPIGIDSEGDHYISKIDIIDTLNLSGLTSTAQTLSINHAKLSGTRVLIALTDSAGPDAYARIIDLNGGTISAVTGWQAAGTTNVSGTVIRCASLGSGFFIVAWLDVAGDVSYRVGHESGGSIVWDIAETKLYTGTIGGGAFNIVTIDEANGRFVMTFTDGVAGDAKAAVYSWGGAVIATDVSPFTFLDPSTLAVDNYCLVSHETNKLVVIVTVVGSTYDSVQGYVGVFTGPSTLTFSPSYVVNTWELGLALARNLRSFENGISGGGFVISDNLIGFPVAITQSPSGGFHYEQDVFYAQIENDAITGYQVNLPLISQPDGHGGGAFHVGGGGSHLLVLDTGSAGRINDVDVSIVDAETMQLLASIKAFSDTPVTTADINPLFIVEMDEGILCAFRTITTEVEAVAIRFPRYVGVAKAGAAANGEVKAVKRGRIRSLGTLNRGGYYRVDYQDGNVAPGKQGDVVGQAISAGEIIA